MKRRFSPVPMDLDEDTDTQRRRTVLWSFPKLSSSTVDKSKESSFCDDCTAYQKRIGNGTASIRNASSQCSFCDKYLCVLCVRQCVECHDLFCSLCSLDDHEQRYDRTFCLACYDVERRRELNSSMNSMNSSRERNNVAEDWLQRNIMTQDQSQDQSQLLNQDQELFDP